MKKASRPFTRLFRVNMNRFMLFLNKDTVIDHCHRLPQRALSWKNLTFNAHGLVAEGGEQEAGGVKRTCSGDGVRTLPGAKNHQGRLRQSCPNSIRDYRE